MDPDRALEEMLELANLILSEPDADADAEQLAEKVEHLDRWLCQGGFVPKRWERARKPVPLPPGKCNPKPTF